MAGASNIEWTDATWNPTTGCTRVSAGCDHCYAVAMTHRLEGASLGAVGLRDLRAIGARYAGLTVINDRGERHFNGKVRVHEDVLETPLRWKKPRRIFVNSMSDLFHRDVPFEFIAKVFTTMAMAGQHTFQILTKRPERLVEFFNWNYPPAAMSSEMAAADWLGCWPNVWLGTSVEDQKTADERIPHLLKVPAAVRFLSVEPMLGPVDLEHIHANHEGASIDYGNGPGPVKPVMRSAFNTGPWYGIVVPADPGNSEQICERLREHFGGDNSLHWVIVGGESGPKARPMHPDWVRSVRDQCQAAGVPLFFKQWGEWKPIDQPWKEDSPSRLKANEQWCNFAGGIGFHGEEVWRMRRVGKNAAGAELDGRQHREWPATEAMRQQGNEATSKT